MASISLSPTLSCRSGRWVCTCDIAGTDYERPSEGWRCADACAVAKIGDVVSFRFIIMPNTGGSSFFVVADTRGHPMGRLPSRADKLVFWYIVDADHVPTGRIIQIYPAAGIASWAITIEIEFQTRPWFRTDAERRKLVLEHFADHA